MPEPTIRVVSLTSGRGHAICDLCGDDPPVLCKVGDVLHPGRADDGDSIVACPKCIFAALRTMRSLCRAVALEELVKSKGQAPNDTDFANKPIIRALRAGSLIGIAAALRALNDTLANAESEDALE